MTVRPNVSRPLARVVDGVLEQSSDEIAVERALEMRVDERPVSVTLRTPGHDRALALGFLAGEGLIGAPTDVREVREHMATCSDQPDTVEVALASGVAFDWSRLERHFAMTSACGLCGRAHLDSLRSGLTPIASGSPLEAARIATLSARLGGSQVGFDATGGLHAAAWCDGELEPVVVREDIGRHNAVDKVIGWMLEADQLPAHGGLMWVSGRAGAELVLKSARARIPTLAAVGAPSSLAIELAETAGMTLIGFLREGRMNVYCGVERLRF